MISALSAKDRCLLWVSVDYLLGRYHRYNGFDQLVDEAVAIAGTTKRVALILLKIKYQKY